MIKENIRKLGMQHFEKFADKVELHGSNRTMLWHLWKIHVERFAQECASQQQGEESISCDELYNLRSFIESQRLMMVEKYDRSTTTLSKQIFAFVSNMLTDIMDEMTTMLEKPNSIKPQANKDSENDIRDSRIENQFDSWLLPKEIKKRLKEYHNSKENAKKSFDVIKKYIAELQSQLKKRDERIRELLSDYDNNRCSANDLIVGLRRTLNKD